MFDVEYILVYTWAIPVLLCVAAFAHEFISSKEK